MNWQGSGSGQYDKYRLVWSSPVLEDVSRIKLESKVKDQGWGNQKSRFVISVDGEASVGEPLGHEWDEFAYEGMLAYFRTPVFEHEWRDVEIVLNEDEHDVVKELSSGSGKTLRIWMLAGGGGGHEVFAKNTELYVWGSESEFQPEYDENNEYNEDNDDHEYNDDYVSDCGPLMELEPNTEFNIPSFSYNGESGKDYFRLVWSSPQVDNILNMELNFMGKDQGWGNQKSRLLVSVDSLADFPATKLFKVEYDGLIVKKETEIFSHEWKDYSMRIEDQSEFMTELYKNYEPFYVVRIWAYAGDDGGHQINVDNLSIKMNIIECCIEPEPYYNNRQNYHNNYHKMNFTKYTVFFMVAALFTLVIISILFGCVLFYCCCKVKYVLFKHCRRERKCSSNSESSDSEDDFHYSNMSSVISSSSNYSSQRAYEV